MFLKLLESIEIFEKPCMINICVLFKEESHSKIYEKFQVATDNRFEAMWKKYSKYIFVS